MAQLMAYDYDTEALRVAARKLSKCAQALSNGARPSIEKIRGGIGDNLVGEAGTALEARMGEMNSDVNVMINSINDLARTLNRYAAELERTARQLRQRM